MRRSDFIKNITMLFGWSVLPKAYVKQFTKIYLLQSFVRGFQFYHGPKLLSTIKAGTILELVRESANKHDASAIALHHNKIKIGYLPRESNEIIAKLIDADVLNLHAEVTHLKTEAATWEKIFIAVYILKEMTGPVPQQMASLTTLETPHYRSLKMAENKIVRIYYEDDTGEIEDEFIGNGEIFYEALVDHSRNDEVYNLIHEGFKNGEEMDQAVAESRIIINRSKLPSWLKADKLIRSLDENIIELDNAFDEKGYVVANVARLAALSAGIDNFHRIKDKEGRWFYEAEFKNEFKQK